MPEVQKWALGLREYSTTKSLLKYCTHILGLSNNSFWKNKFEIKKFISPLRFKVAEMGFLGLKRLLKSQI